MTRSRRLLPRMAQTKSMFIDEDRKARPVVPVRFVRACRRGHIGDIDWHGFVHAGGADAPCRPSSGSTSGARAATCPRSGPLRVRPGAQIAEATQPEGRALETATGRPRLGKFAEECCEEPNRLLVRTASNAYFSQTMSVISLPEEDKALGRAVNQVWEHYLKHVNDLEDLRYERRKRPPVQAALEGFSDEEILEEIRESREASSSRRRRRRSRKPRSRP